MMPARMDGLRQALDGLRESGLVLISYDGSRFGPAGMGDDPGLYLVVPLLADWLGWPAVDAAGLFLIASLALSAVLAGAGVTLLCRRWRWRIASWAVLAAAFARLCSSYYFAGGRHVYGDLYVFYSLTPLALVPLLLWAVLRLGDRWSYCVAAVAGVLAGCSNLLRGFSGVPVLLLGAVLIGGSRGRPAIRSLVVAILLFSALLPHLVMHQLIERRDKYLAQVGVDQDSDGSSHPFWHSVYIGLGYVSNVHGIRYQDEVAIARVATLAPNTRYLSAEYNSVLRKEVMRLAWEDPSFVGRAFGAKTLEVLKDVFGNRLHVVLLVALCWWAAPPVARNRWVGVSLLAGAAFAALPGILVNPGERYTNGVFALLLLYLVHLLAQLDRHGVKPALAARWPRLLGTGSLKA
jgi:hypothetical protein